MKLNDDIKIALEKIKFIEKYKNMSAKYSFDFKESYENYNNNEVINIFDDLGYKTTFNKKENFFKIVDRIPPYRFQFHISLKYGVLEFIWAVWKNDELLTGIPWESLKRLIDCTDETVRRPVFRNYNDLKEVLREALLMYEDFKIELEGTRRSII